MPKSRLGQSLSHRQKQVYDLRKANPDAPWRQIADSLGIKDPKAAMGYWREALIRKGERDGNREAATGELLPTPPSSRRIQRAVREISRQELRDLAGNVSHTALVSLHEMPDNDWDGISPRDRAVIAGIMIDKKRLYDGEPSVIIGFQDGPRVQAMMEAMIEEARRRGFTPDDGDAVLDADYTTVVEGGEQMPVPAECSE